MDKSKTYHIFGNVFTTTAHDDGKISTALGLTPNGVSEEDVDRFAFKNAVRTARFSMASESDSIVDDVLSAMEKGELSLAEVIFMATQQWDQQYRVGMAILTKGMMQGIKEDEALVEMAMAIKSE